MHFMNKKKRYVVALAIFLFALLLAMMIGIFMHTIRRKPLHGTSAPVSLAASRQEDFSSTDERFTVGSAKPDTVALSLQQKEPPHPPAHKKDIARHPASAVSLPAASDSQEQSDSGSFLREEAEGEATGGCENDTLSPWVYTDPSGGLHHAALSVKLFATKPCAIEWKMGSAGPWSIYHGEDIRIERTTTLFLQASDSCGNKMQKREEQYDIKAEDTGSFCPPNMEHVLVGATSFCIDRYEWPNIKGSLPRSYVSVYQAMDTCASVGKRLCTSDEWTIACTGPYGWKYPYGAQYEIYACNTNDTSARPSGARSECRGYFGVYDMSGNCAEWTSTKSGSNIHFYNVMGGFWESGPQSGCFDVRYSYFPQNRHNPVGFRCCKDAKSNKTQHGAE